MDGAGISNLWLGSLSVGILAPVTGFEYREFLRYVGAITALMSVVLAILLVAF
ncbi:MAG: short chain fatty acid transporter [Halanaeroarchaeum sp.]